MLINIHKLLLLIIIGSLLAACSTKQISTAPSHNLKHIANSVVVKVGGQNINSTVLDTLAREIKGRLIIAGFDIDKETDKKINLNVFGNYSGHPSKAMLTA